MPVEFRCLQCQKLLRVADSAAGKKARCPDCGSIQEVPLSIGSKSPANSPEDSPAPMTAPQSPAVDISAPLSPFAPTTPLLRNQPTTSGDAAPIPDRQYSNPFAPTSQANTLAIDSARSRCVPPAVGLLIVGSISAVLNFGGVILDIILAATGANDVEEFAPTFVMLVAGFFISLIILAGGRKMQQLQSYGLAMTASVLAIVPCQLCCVATLPVGIWSLTVLLDPQVKDAYR